MTEASPAWRKTLVRSPFVPDCYGAIVTDPHSVLGVAWDFDERRAKVRALGEATERWDLRHPTPPHVVAAEAELTHPHLDLSRAATVPSRLLDLPVNRRFRWTPETVMSWHESETIDGERLLVPSDLLWLRASTADRTMLRPTSSIGTAAGPDRESALENALLEVHERHIVAEATRLGVRAATVTVDDPGLRDHVDQLEISGFSVTVGRLHSAPYVYIVCLRARGADAPAAAFGTGAGRTDASATRAALMEAIQVMHLGAQLLRIRPRVLRDAGKRRAMAWADGRGDPTAYFGGAGFARAVPLPGTLRAFALDEHESTVVVRAIAVEAHYLRAHRDCPIMVAPRPETGQRDLDDPELERCGKHPYV